MFRNVDTQDLDSFRDAIVDVIAASLRKYKTEHPGIDDTRNWGMLQEIKGKIISEQALTDIVQQAKKTHLLKQEVGSEALNDLLTELIQLEENHPNLFAKDKEKLKAQIPNIASSSVSIFASSSAADVTSANIKERLTTQINALEKKAIDKSELVKFFMSEEEANSHYHGFYIDVHQITAMDADASRSLEKTSEIMDKKIVAEIDTIIEKCLQDGVKRAQVILKFQDHYVPIDIDIENKSCFVFDAARDFRRLRLHSINKYSEHINTMIDAHSPEFEMNGQKRDGKLQKSERGCWLYALYMSQQVSVLPNIHPNLIDNSTIRNGIHCVEWIKLPPQFVFMSESTVFFDYYKDKRKEKVDEIDHLTNNNQKGYGFNFVMAQYQNRLQAICAVKTEKEMNDAVQKFEKKLVPTSLEYKA
jgi:hypothetical protein